MGSIYKMEGKPINIPESNIVKIILQRCVGSAVKSLAELGGIVTTGVQPTGRKSSEKLRNSGNLQIVKSVGEHVDSVADKVDVGHIGQVLARV